MVSVEKGEFVSVKPERWIFIDAFRDLKDDEAVVIFLKDGRRFIVAATNANGGVCDDCRSDYYDEEAIGYQILKVK